MKSDDKMLLLSTLSSIIPGVSILVIFGLLSFFFSPPFMVFYFLVMSVMLSRDAWMVWHEELEASPMRVFKMWGYLSAFLFVLYFLYGWLGSNGIWSMIGVTVGLALYLLWTRRKAYMGWIRYIEKRFWGETAEERWERNKK